MNHEDDPVDLLVMEYLAAQEVGDVPDLDALVQRGLAYPCSCSRKDIVLAG